MRKYVVILLYILSCSLHGLSQQYVAKMNLDSLKKVLVDAKDTQRINTLNLTAMRILFGALEKGQLDEAAIYTQEALLLSKDLNYDKGLGNALLNEGIIRINKGYGLHKSLSLLQTALSLLKKSPDSLLVASCFGYIANCFNYLGENKTAIAFYDSAQHLFQQQGDTITSAWKTVEKGQAYFSLGNYSEAYKTYSYARELTPNNDTLLQPLILGNLALLFLGANLPENTIDYVQKIKDYYPGIDFTEYNKLPWPLARGLRLCGHAFLNLGLTDSALQIAKLIPLQKQNQSDNLFYGRLYAATRNTEKALLYLTNGYRLSRQASIEIQVARYGVALAQTYLSIKNIPRAIYYANDALRISRNIHALLEERNAVGVLAEIHKANKNYSKAYQFSQLYTILSDSLAPEEYRRKLSLLQVKNDLNEQKQQALLLTKEKLISQQQINFQQAQLKRKSFLLYISIAALLVILLLATLVFRNTRLKKRKEELQRLMLQSSSLLEQKRNEQRVTELQKEKKDLEMYALRAQMNPHFIFNSLSSINRFILINRTEEASDYLTKFSRLIRMTLHNSEKSLITLESELEALRLYLDLERLRFKNAFDYSISFINAVDVSSVFIPPLLIQPFAENAIWHGLLHKDGPGCLDIEMSVEENVLICTITDNGIGRE
ncbi:MAG TPA: histidine kinase, partial [Agriterribacter sp.]|nr:histidine kinase [Agriterribacter sp.]